MEPNISYRPRVSRETRLLLTAGVLAVAALWLLARFRFQDVPPTPNPIPAVLSQLASAPKYEDLAIEIAQLQPRVEALLLALAPPSSPVPGSLPASHRIAALRIRDDLAVTLLPNGSAVDDASLLARDPASGLAVVRVPDPASGSLPAAWTPRRLQQPRYFVASDVSPTGVSLRPVFVGALDPVEDPLWSEPAWSVPERSDLAPGSFLFANDGELVGMAIGSGAARVIVPAAVLLAEAARLAARPTVPAGTVGVEVQALTAPVASATGAVAGVVVTWVAPGGAADGQLLPGDVVEAVDGRPLVTPRHWDVRAARLLVGETLTLRVRREGAIRDLVLTAGQTPPPPVTSALGLTLRLRRGTGAEVVRVEPGSAAARAGLAVGDLITLIGSFAAPTPAQVTRSFDSAAPGQPVMIVVTRGDTHRVTTLER